MTPLLTDAELLAQFARDLGTVILVALAVWFPLAFVWTAAGIWKEWRR